MSSRFRRIAIVAGIMVPVLIITYHAVQEGELTVAVLFNALFAPASVLAIAIAAVALWRGERVNR